MTLRALRQKSTTDAEFGLRVSNAIPGSVTKFPSLGLRATPKAPPQLLEGEWAELLNELREMHQSTSAAEERATRIATHAEGVARQAVEELSRLKEELDVRAAAEQEALRRVTEAEQRAFEA